MTRKGGSVRGVHKKFFPPAMGHEEEEGKSCDYAKQIHSTQNFPVKRRRDLRGESVHNIGTTSSGEGGRRYRI